MSSASESVCSRDGEGDTELDLDVNILPRQGCRGPSPPTPQGRQGRWGSGRGRARGRRLRGGGVRRRLQAPSGRGVAGPGTREPKARGVGSAARARARSLPLGLEIAAGPAGTRRGGPLSLQQAASPPAPRDSPNSGGPDWLGGAGELAGGRPRAPIRAGAGWRAAFRASGRSRRVALPGTRPSLSPPPSLASDSPHPSRPRTHPWFPRARRQGLHRNWELVCFRGAWTFSWRHLLDLGGGEPGARIWCQTSGLGIPTQSFGSPARLRGALLPAPVKQRCQRLLGPRGGAGQVRLH